MAFKTFVDGNVLDAADLNDYLMEQAVIACTSATRPSSPNEGMTIVETDTDRMLVYDGSAWQRVNHTAAAGRTGCRLRRASASSAITSGTTHTITWDTEDADTDGFIAVSATTVTIPSGLGGLYACTAGIIWSGNPTGGTGVGVWTALKFSIGGTNYAVADHNYSNGANVSTGGVYVTGVSATLYLAAADTIQVEVQNGAGTNRTVTGFLHVHRVAI